MVTLLKILTYDSNLKTTHSNTVTHSVTVSDNGMRRKGGKGNVRDK